MQEIWKSIKGFEGLYEVSNLGRVKSYRVSCNGKIIKNRISKGGYYIVGLCFNGKQSTKAVHKLVAIAFLNHTPNGYKEVVDHIDNFKLNNRVDNLQLITQRQNSCKEVRGVSIHLGVCRFRNKWRAAIRINGKKTYIGDYNCELAAAKAYQDKLNSLSL